VKQKHVYKRSEYICNSSFKHRICDSNQSNTLRLTRLKDLKFWQQCRWRPLFIGMLCRVNW